eukprot:612406-Lingulodinium_polyedra.AAC.1
MFDIALNTVPNNRKNAATGFASAPLASLVEEVDEFLERPINGTWRPRPERQSFRRCGGSPPNGRRA